MRSLDEQEAERRRNLGPWLVPAGIPVWISGVPLFTEEIDLLLKLGRAALEIEDARAERAASYGMPVPLRGQSGARDGALARERAMNATDARLGRAEAEYRVLVAELAKAAGRRR